MSFFTPVTPTRVSLNFECDGLAWMSGKSIDVVMKSPYE